MFLIVFQNAIVSFTGLCLQLWWVLLIVPSGFLQGHGCLLSALVYWLSAAWASTPRRTKGKQEQSSLLNQVAICWPVLSSVRRSVNVPIPTVSSYLYLWCLTGWLPLSGEGTSGNDWGPAKLDSIIFSNAVTGCLSAFEYCGKPHAQSWAGG